MSPRLLPAVLALLVLAAAPAVAAAPGGAYAGTSVNKEIYVYGALEARTDKGKVTFRVKGRTLSTFRLSGQEFMCGTQHPATLVTVPKIALSSAGAGKGTFTHPDLGPFRVTVKVTSKGRATGTVKGAGLCDGSKATFTAKRR